ncbi:unnamed protein product [Mycena citricolor]|uniref:Uncharacterized protein n=1 Tax=Mycena citricolor TaxID=2018698 RepID=A0AAD2GZV7_9AGAR|nr:unnamed protein product [Mycena citricolor]
MLRTSRRSGSQSTAGEKRTESTQDRETLRWPRHGKALTTPDTVEVESAKTASDGWRGGAHEGGFTLGPS